MRAPVFGAYALVAGLAWGLAGCRAPVPLEPVLAERCEPVGGAEPVRFEVPAASAGTLRIYLEQRGISLGVTVMGIGAAGAQVTARSPIERFGAVTFLTDARTREPISVTISSRDSPEIVGEVCFSAERLNAGDARRLRAERAFANAGVAVNADQVDAAFAHYLQAARDFDGLDSRRAAEARHAMAELAYWRLARVEDAHVLAGWALADFGSGADAGLRSTLLLLQAETLLESQPYGAKELRERVFALTRTAEHLAAGSRFGAREVPRLDTLRGFVEFQMDRTSAAAGYFTKAAVECQRLKDWECYARARQNLATLAEEASDLPVALGAFADALEALPRGFRPELRADISGNLGRLQGQAGLFSQSEQSHRTSIELYASVRDCDGVRIGLARLGTLLVQVGSIAEGRTYLLRAASLECPALLAVAARDDGATAELERGMRALPRAITCPQTPPAEKLSSTGRLAVFNALLALRDAARFENEDGEAAPCLAAAHPYAFAPRMQLRLANAEGAALLKQGDAQAARVEFEGGIAVANRSSLPPTHENRSLAYLGLARAALLENKADAALSNANRALVLSSARADVGQIVDSLQLMARSQGEGVDTPAAESILGTAAHLIEQVPIQDLDAEKRATWLATQHAVFADLTNLFAQPVPGSGDADPARLWKAFDVSERGRSRSLRYAVNQATDVRVTQDTAGTSDAYHALMAQLVALGSSKSGEQSPRAVIDALAEMTAVRGTADLAAHEVLQHRLAALDATAVEYAAGREDMLAFVLDSGHITVVRLASRKAIAAAAGKLYERLRDPEAASLDITQAAARVAELVWWPIAEHVTHRRVLVIPDDSLHTVPFAVLPWSAAKNAQTLLQRVELSMMPSMLFVARPPGEQAKTNARLFELIGDPVFRAGDWQRECAPAQGSAGSAETPQTPVNTLALPRLPGSRTEVLAISELAHRVRPATRVQTRLGCEATPSGLREAAAAAPELLHIATHGYVDAYRPRLSALALTPESAVQGGAAWFGLLDILDTKVDARLVVLSACDTSRGRLLAGEGVLGPAQAFLQAGAASVIASYWRIEDARTAPFMQLFYTHLLGEHLTAADALRRTQLELANDASPHIWAAFTLYGWPDTTL